MRHTPTDAESKMWSLLRNRRFAEYKFRRQLPIDRYIVDFVCMDAKLIVELDGSQHVENTQDQARDAFLAAQGYRILRLWNHEVLGKPDNALEAVWVALQPEPPEVCHGNP